MLKTEAARSRKQRRTLKQLHEDLRELGFEGSYDRVAAFARVWKAGQSDRVNPASKRTPPLWIAAFNSTATWEERASAVLASELEQIPPMDIVELADKLWLLDAGFQQKTLISHISSGALSLPIFLRCLVALRSRSMDLYVDYKDLVAAARNVHQE